MRYLVFGILTVLFVGECVNGVNIQFFRQNNLTDLIYESNSTSSCNNMPADKRDVRIKSIKTDTCLMVYIGPNCIGNSIKLNPENDISTWYTFVRSFHICNEDIGGPQLKIDITKWLDYSESGVLESYRNVCTCINVPQYVQDMPRWSINNYGNDFLAYHQPNCPENKWKAEHVPAGHWCWGGLEWMDLFEEVDSVTNTKYKIRSIGPDPNSKYFKTSCSQIPVNYQTEDSVRVENEIKLGFLEDILLFLSYMF